MNRNNKAWMLTSAAPFKSLTLSTGVNLTGPWTFTSQGTIGAYPGFLNGGGDFVPLSGVVTAYATSPVTAPPAVADDPQVDDEEEDGDVVHVFVDDEDDPTTTPE